MTSLSTTHQRTRVGGGRPHHHVTFKIDDKGRVFDCGNMVSRPLTPDGQEALDKAVCLALANNARFKAPLLPQERKGRFQWRANQ